MKCVIANVNLGTWCRAIHSLTQVGDEDLYFDFSDTILTIATANSSYSVYATFMFFKPFFTSYQMTSDEPEKVVVPAKTILKPYKTLRVAKTFLSSELGYAPDDDHITVTSEARSQASVTYRLRASSKQDVIDLDSDPDSLRNCIKTEAKILSSCLANFGHVKGLAEITLKIEGSKVTLRNCVTDTARKDGSVVTEYYLSAQDFNHFVFNDEATELTFGFREFKIFTTFAEQLKKPLCIHFQDKEDPVIITIRDELFEARLFMATRIHDPFNGTNASSNAGSSMGTNGRISNVTSQGSDSLSRSGPPQEIIRERVPTPVAAQSPVTTARVSNNSNDPPPAKRPRRTDALSGPAPPASQSLLDDNASSPSMLEDPFSPPEASHMDNNHGSINIAGVVEQIEKRKKSTAYRSLQKIVSGPCITELDYLNTIPGHDVVLCPDSDEESP